jgi:hypothetical protein
MCVAHAKNLLPATVNHYKYHEQRRNWRLIPCFSVLVIDIHGLKIWGFSQISCWVLLFIFTPLFYDEKTLCQRNIIASFLSWAHLIL